jgi:hypothetical protein
VFDPVDTEDNAVIKQGISCLQFYEEPGIEHSRNIGIFSEQRGSKKTKEAKYVPFELLFNTGQQSVIPRMAANQLFVPSITENYYYLFYKEINPPPPKNYYLSEHLFV